MAAVSGVQKEVLVREIPDLVIVEIPGYGIKYDKNRALTILRLIFSIPKILIRVKRENAWIRRWARLGQPDLIISDNRYGLHVAGIPSVFMTHQLLIRTPWGPIADRWLQRINYSFIRRFSLCWVPDTGGETNLAGELSHPPRMPRVPVRYVGWLSRFTPCPPEAGASVSGPDPIPPNPAHLTVSDPIPPDGIDLLVLLSGPEPQRTLLEKKIMDQVAHYSGHVVLVRGLPNQTAPLTSPPHVKVYNHLPAADLGVLIRSSGQIICRSGYSTVMDLVRLGRRAIMIPTPGQTEQEYLGHYLASRGWALCVDQKGFSLIDALTAAREMNTPQIGQLPDPFTGEGLLQQAIADVLSSAARQSINSAMAAQPTSI